MSELSTVYMIDPLQPSRTEQWTFEPLSASQRYEDLDKIGEGGMGEVRRVRDTVLQCELAMKVLKPDLMHRPAAVARFVREAQATAQLRHPSIIAVHDLGRLDDGRLYFTMPEVRGSTLAQMIAAVHAVSRSEWEATAQGWTLQSLIETFAEVCDAVAYAHAQGVVHRDLKPANVMVGDFGEVVVLDWGLAKVRGDEDVQGDEDLVVTDLSRDDWLTTGMGCVMGTPAYMPPEQARAVFSSVDERSDVYSLGAMLRHILGGQAPYGDSDAVTVLAEVRAGPPRPLMRRADGPPLPAELVEICRTAMERLPEDRYVDATALARAVRGWLETRAAEPSARAA